MFADCPEGSAAPTVCPSDMVYPYKVCVGGIITTECLRCPNDRNGIIKMNLPIFYDIRDEDPIAGGFDYYFGGGMLGRYIILSELEIAFNKWNCICGEYVSFNYLDFLDSECEDFGNYEDVKTHIPIKFSANYRDFKDASNDPSNANVDDDDPCYPNPPTMYFNVTKKFEEAGNFLMNDYFIMNNDNYEKVIERLEIMPDVPNNYKIFNVIEVAIQQIGQILGMSYSDECSCEESIMAPPKQVNNPVDKETITISIEGTYSGLLFPGPAIIYDGSGNIIGYIYFHINVSNPDILIGDIYDVNGNKIGHFDQLIIIDPNTGIRTFNTVNFTVGKGEISGTIDLEGIISGTVSISREFLIINNIPLPRPLFEISDCDKCMFKRLYCEECSDGIYYYEPQTQKLYPNPGKHIVTIDFELPKHTDNLKMSVINPLGKVVLVPIENKIFSAGEHSILINVDILPTGVYYIIINADNYRTTQPLTIIR